MKTTAIFAALAFATLLSITAAQAAQTTSDWVNSEMTDHVQNEDPCDRSPISTEERKDMRKELNKLYEASLDELARKFLDRWKLRAEQEKLCLEIQNKILENKLTSMP